ncbi:MAG: glutathione S-transferase family protein [bacterium]
MQLIGYLDSPFVRRVAISMRFLGIDYEHRELSIFRDFEEFQKIHPAVKVPTLVCDNGEAMIDSTLIIEYLEQHVAGRSLMPEGKEDFQKASNIIGLALIAMEKVAQIIYETGLRPEEKQHAPWLVRIEQQLRGTVGLLEEAVKPVAEHRWLFGDRITQADISTAVVWRFIQHVDRARQTVGDYPALVEFSASAEKLDEFIDCPLSD